MLNVNSIKNGIVIDHIKKGMGIKIYNFLKLDNIKGSTALLMNVPSKKQGRKDIIKIENLTNIDFKVLGLIDPNITVNIIENEKIKEKIKLTLPEQVTNIIKCKNPRCITSTEHYIPHKFYLSNREKCEYRCEYCDESYNLGIED